MLTDTRCRNAKPKDRLYRLRDSLGLYLEIKPNGVKAWRYRFELSGKENMIGLGDYAPAPAGESKEHAQERRARGRLTLAEARAARDDAKSLVRQGISPAHQKQLDRITRVQESATTFQIVADEWLAMKDWEEVTKKRRRSLMRRVIFPFIGTLPIRQVTPAHALDILKRTAEAHGPTVAAEARRTMSGVFELAVSTLRADADPTYPVRKALPANKTQHKRALTIQEIGSLMRDVGAYNGHFQTIGAFRLMWLTLCRPNEAVEAQWSEFDLDRAVWTIPPERMKGRREHVVPLPRQAIEELRKIHALTGQNAHVFPNRDNRKTPMTGAALRQALKGLGWAGRYSPHATRTTGSTRLNELGFRGDWIERQLAHEEPNAVRRTYNHATHFDDRARMMQQWADLLDTWANSTESP
ncbi:tyrosine-type recombinase/integrase [Burkholderia diffusa]|uniref:tyrosine-type recombinase/integrase n=1 Tax=Burkholderia diffusa TaxID=488732 RepID=UPI00158D6038|nr:tyrosine-type recombinase/integrase [Burkholderia diffusa]